MWSYSMSMNYLNKVECTISSREFELFLVQGAWNISSRDFELFLVKAQEVFSEINSALFELLQSWEPSWSQYVEKGRTNMNIIGWVNLWRPMMKSYMTNHHSVVLPIADPLVCQTCKPHLKVLHSQCPFDI